jgi:hypothetical protein
MKGIYSAGQGRGRLGARDSEPASLSSVRMCCKAGGGEARAGVRAEVLGTEWNDLARQSHFLHLGSRGRRRRCSSLFSPACPRSRIG